jgi:hypothetical protein
LSLPVLLVVRLSGTAVVARTAGAKVVRTERTRAVLTGIATSRFQRTMVLS